MEGCIGYWPLNSSVTNSINGITSTITGSVPFVTGKIGNALQFTGNNANFIQSDSDIIGVNGTSLTISCWMQFSTANNLTRLFGCWEYLSKGSFYLTQKYLLGGNVGIYFFIVSDNSDTGANATYSSEILVLNTWYNITCVFDGSKPTEITKAKIFVNGINSTAGYIGTINTTLNTNSKLLIGKLGDSDPYPANGLIDEIVIWNRALSEHEIKRLYNGGRGFKLLAA